MARFHRVPSLCSRFRVAQGGGMSGSGLAVPIGVDGLGWIRRPHTPTLLATADEVISRSCCGA